MCHLAKDEIVLSFYLSVQISEQKEADLSTKPAAVLPPHITHTHTQPLKH